MERGASAVWQGSLKDGAGFVSTESGVLENSPYSYGTRFENNKRGTNPEELIAAAHAACFSMALSAQLTSAGLTATSIKTQCRIILEKTAAGWRITESQLETAAHVPGADVTTFEKAAADAKAGCPISLLLNAKVTLTCYLEAADTMGLVG